MYENLNLEDICENQIFHQHLVSLKTRYGKGGIVGGLSYERE
nr:MAG TPA: hypothetical protein [Caudoviricetes sp.]